MLIPHNAVHPSPTHRSAEGDTAPPHGMVGSGTRGFTLLEVLVALIILTVAILGVASSAGRLSTVSAHTQVRTLALQSVEDRLSLIRLDPRYVELDSIYAGQEDELPGLDGFKRTTEIARTEDTQEGGTVIDYQHISVTVEGPGLPKPITRTITLGAP